MTTNLITIELCAEDRERLDKIARTVERLIEQGLTVNAYEPAEPTEDKAPKAPEQDPNNILLMSVDTASVEEHPVENPFPAESTYKLADIQSKVVQLSAAGKKAEVRDIVKAYAEKVSAIPADKFGEVMAKLAGLEG